MPIRPENRHQYPADWPAISLRIRTVRAAGRCECQGECGRGTHTGRCPNRNGQPAYGTGSKVVLTTAHLDHQPENSDDTNLRAMCQGCHLHYDRQHHRETAANTRRAALAATGQLALDITGTPPPQPAIAVRVEEITALTYTTRETAEWWIRYRDHGPTGRFVAVPGRISFPGQLVDVLCDDHPHAEWLRDHLIEHGIPKAALKIISRSA